VVVAEKTARAYLSANGYPTAMPNTIFAVTFPTSTPVIPGGTSSTIKESIHLKVTQQHKTFFWPLVGIPSVNLQGSGGAHAARAMTDIMLSIDTTGSMYLNGKDASPSRNDFLALRNAVQGFINQVNPSTSDIRGPRIGIARFAGVKCAWQRSGTGADGDAFIDVRSSGNPNEYDTACSDDMEVLVRLTNNDADLTQVATAPVGSGVACPTASLGACPLRHVAYTAPQIAGTPTAIQGVDNGSYQTNNSTCFLPTSNAYTAFVSVACTPTYTGTKLPNGINIMNNVPPPPGKTSTYAWHTDNGGRNDTLNEGNARKVLVMMTDGFNEGWPSTGPQQNPGQWDLDLVSQAATLKNGPDTIAGTADDVEIYTIGFFCVPSSSSCKSDLADSPTPHPCPSLSTVNYSTLGGSPIDDLLRNASSSTGNSCDHYFPLGKTESLPALFQQLAGSISRGQLTD
jgi:hypothetical protein